MVIEKLLKAIYAKNNKGAPYAPKTHDLLYLAEKMKMELTKEQRSSLDTITRFNLEARYDDYKESFRQNCTNEYTAKQTNKYKGGTRMVKKSVDDRIMEIVQKYVEKVCEKYQIKAIILFGSYAKGTEHEDSDIDIAVITDDIKTDRFDEEINLMQLRWDIDLRIEPHIITVADYENDETPFVVEVKNTGIKVA